MAQEFFRYERLMAALGSGRINFAWTLRFFFSLPSPLPPGWEVSMFFGNPERPTVIGY